ncbi:MAG: Cna B-type domain-containing protein, partial [Clostridia bacterium]|nr:Cna B-type domain-containing protein [Clostridia bacterium]
MKKAISLFLALLLCLNYLPTFDLFEAAVAENVWHGDSYKVDVKAGSNGYTYQSSYKTPCHAYEFSNHMVTNGTRRTDYPQYYASDIPQLLILLNAESDYTWTPNGVYEFGKSNYEVLYCCDAVTGYVHGVHYKRMNLEDSSYYDPDAAKHIRAIVTNSYPYISVEQMKADLKAEGFKDADKLTRADLITAIQTAIWSYANSDENPPSFYSQTFDVTANTQWGRVMHDYSNEMRDADGKAWWYECKVNLKTGAGILIDDEIGARIGALIEHLKKREPVDPVEKQVIISKLNIVDFAPVMEVDGLYRVMLRANLNNSGSSANDDISLDIYVDDVFFGTKKVMMGTESYDFSVLAKPEQTIKIVVSGTQILPTGVYFYEAEGGREVSQSLVGIAGGATEVYSEDSVVIPEIEGVTADLKLSKVDNNNKPLTGAEFTLYAKGEKGTVKVGTYAVDEAGELLIEDLLPGEYLLEETKIPFGYLAPEQSIQFEVTKTGYILLTQGDHAEIVDGDSYNVTVKKDGDVMIDEYVPELEIDIIPGKTTSGQVSEKIGSDSEFVLIVRSGEVISGDVTVTVNKSFSGTINSILPALKFDRNDLEDQALQKKIRELYTDEHFVDPATIIVPPAPVGYPFLYAGHAGDYSAHYVSKVKVYFKRDLNGDPIKDENGNYVIDRLTKSNGTPLTYKGVATTNINGPFDQKTGTRARQFLLKDALGNVLYAYCIDVETDAVNNSWYRLANLEDNDYYATEDAENRVRAILEKGYWGTAEGVGSLESLKDALKKFVRSGAVETEYDITFVIRGAKYTSNSVLADGEYVGDGVICHTVTEHVTLTEELIDGLTEGEALDAMTMAIWTYANGSQSTLDGKDGAVMGDLGYGSCASGDSINGQNDFAGAARTKALYAYLIGLEGKQKSTVIINDKTFAENMKLIVGKKIADGIYEGKLRFTLGTELGEKDNLTVALTYVDAYGKTQTLEVPLTGVGALVAENGFYTIGGLTLKAGEAFDFSLNVYGDQYLERGAYILTAQNGSQTMVTIAEGMNAVDVTKTASVSFTVEESRHYEKTYTKTEQTLVVVNYPETVSISGSKTWDDNNDQDGVRPEKITIYLLADGETVATKVVTADDNWKWSFVGMNKYNGTEEITYTVLEEVVDGYKTSYDGFNVTNTHIPEKIEIEGSKIWNDNDDQDGIRPDSIEIILFANGEEIDRKTVTKDDWTFKFTDLPKYENGVEIKYTVKEVAVEGYKTTYETSENNFNIINTHIPEKIEIEGTKTWIDNDDQDGIRPDSIEIILFANG